MNRWFWIYVALFSALAAVEVYGVWFRPEKRDTISELTAYVFRTGTTAGFAALSSLIVFLLLWYPIHTRRYDTRTKAPEPVDHAKP